MQLTLNIDFTPNRLKFLQDDINQLMEKNYQLELEKQKLELSIRSYRGWTTKRNKSK